MLRRLFPALLLTLVSGVASPAAKAAPQDARAGETRVFYKKEGTPLRAEPQATAATVATFPPGASAVVREVRLPWLRVEGSPGAGQPPLSGWVRAYLMALPSELSAPAGRPALGGTGGVDQRMAATAGRQLSAETEQGFRGKRPDVARYYPHVDAMEEATRAMAPADSVEFLMEGYLGRPGADLALPGRVPATPPRQGSGRRSGGGGGLPGPLGGLLKGGAKELGKAVGGDRLGDLFGSVADVMVQGMLEDLNKAFTPDQEYYLGRAVAASAFAKYGGVEPNQALRAYVRRVGDALVRASNRVGANYGGYHFDVLPSDEVNGVSGPGGFVLLTRGAVLACDNEDELAGLLAHELSHVTLKHGEAVLRQGQKMQGFMKGLVTVGAGAAGLSDPRLQQGLVNFMDQVVGEMVTTSTSHAYGSQLEFASDREGTYILHDVNYDWGALRAALAHMGAEGHIHGGATHASPQARANALAQAVAPLGAYVPRDTALNDRTLRFNVALGRAAAPPPAPAPVPAPAPAPVAPPAPSPGGWPAPAPVPPGPPAGPPSPGWPAPR